VLVLVLLVMLVMLLLLLLLLMQVLVLQQLLLLVLVAVVVRATHGGPVTGTGFLFPIPRKYGDPVGPTPVSPRPRKTPVNGGPVQTRTPVNGDGEPP